MSSEVTEATEEGSTMPSLSNKSREHGELQDMYRRTLAASWVAQPGVTRLFSTLLVNQPLTHHRRNYEPTTVSRISLLVVMAGAHTSITFNIQVATKTNRARPISPQQTTPPDHRGRKALCTAIIATSAKKACNPTDAKASTAGPKTILPLAIPVGTGLLGAEVVCISKP